VGSGPALALGDQRGPTSMRWRVQIAKKSATVGQQARVCQRCATLLR
jgi:hypothetical protein